MKALLWGIGKFGSNTFLKELLSERYEVVAYADSFPRKRNLNGLPVIGPEEAMQMCINQNVDVIVITAVNPEVIHDIQVLIREKILCRCMVKIYIYSEIQDDVENAYIKKYKSRNNQYSINNLSEQLTHWVQEIMGGVAFWIEQVARKGAVYHDDYVERLNNDKFVRYHPTDAVLQLEKYLMEKNNALVLDIGSGLAPVYGETLSNGNHINLHMIDPLAPFYNAINVRYHFREHNCKKVFFGMMEFMACFYERETCDAIIMNNALDHCMDPYKSIIESLYLLKCGGMLHLNHRRAEAVFEKYENMHQWNMDCNEDHEFIIWNQQNGVNVSQKLKDIVEISVYCEEDKETRKDQFVIVNMIKKRGFDLSEYVNVTDERKELAEVVGRLMELLADPEINSVFESLLNG